MRQDDVINSDDCKSANVNLNKLIMEDTSVRRVAPWYDVPRKDVVSIEHPCLIRNVDNGIKSLGGPLALNKVSGCEIKEAIGC